MACQSRSVANALLAIIVPHFARMAGHPVCQFLPLATRDVEGKCGDYATNLALFFALARNWRAMLKLADKFFDLSHKISDRQDRCCSTES